MRRRWRIGQPQPLTHLNCSSAHQKATRLTDEAVLLHQGPKIPRHIRDPDVFSEALVKFVQLAPNLSRGAQFGDARVYYAASFNPQARLGLPWGRAGPPRILLVYPRMSKPSLFVI